MYGIDVIRVRQKFVPRLPDSRACFWTCCFEDDSKYKLVVMTTAKMMTR